MPECKFGMNDKLVMDSESKGKTTKMDKGINIEDIKFH